MIGVLSITAPIILFLHAHIATEYAFFCVKMKSSPVGLAYVHEDNMSIVSHRDE
jgi:hypothetical protein